MVSIFKPLLEKDNSLPKGEKGTLSTIVDKLKIVSIPKGELITSVGEIGLEMYWVLEGEC